MSNQVAKVIVVSAFGRGQGVATELAEKGLAVQVLDLSHAFPWSESEYTGPFPLLADELPKATDVHEIKSGLSVLTAKGPIEFASPLLRLRLQSLGHSEKIMERPSQGFNEDFQKSWLLRLFTFGTRAEELLPAKDADRSFIKSWQVGLVGKAYRWAHKRGLHLGKVAGKYPEVLQGFAIEDVAFGARKQVQGLLVKKERSELLSADQWVWCLSSRETQYLSPLVSQKLFQGESRESVYSWISYEARLPGTDYLPDFFIWMQDPELPWAHDNFMSFFRIEKDHFQIWLKVLSQQRFSSPSLDQEETNWRRALEERLPGLKIDLLRRPVEHGKSSKTVGPALFATFREGVLQKNIEFKGENFYFLSPERVKSLWPHDLFNEEKNIANRIALWWKLELENREKKKMRESRV
jgi:hypothetical protein